MTYFSKASKAALIPFACALGMASAASAATPPARAPAVQAVVDCRKIDDSAQRLACYDGAVSRMEEAEAKGDLVTVDREQRQAARRQAFGFTLPSLSFLDRGEKPEEVDSITLSIASARQGADGKWVIRMQDGAVWRQIDTYEVARSPRSGSTAKVRKGALGSYIMNIDGQPGIKVHRDN